VLSDALLPSAPMLEIRSASASDAEALSTLALASKGHWGYSAEFLAACRDELTVSRRACESGRVVVAAEDDVLAGFYQVAGDPPDGELVHLFVAPGAMGRGVGGLLLNSAKEHARGLRFTTLRLDADPNAEPFYAHLGARTVTNVPSGSIPGRFLPHMVIDL
jgi:GNAT superfamily N-acetyltransferase